MYQEKPIKNVANDCPTGSQVNPHPSRSKISLDSFHAALQLAYKARQLAHEIGFALIGPEIDQDKCSEERTEPKTFFDQLDQVASLIREAIIDINSILGSIRKEIR